MNDTHKMCIANNMIDSLCVLLEGEVKFQKVYVGSGYRDMANEVRLARVSTTEFVREMTGWMPWVNFD